MHTYNLQEYSETSICGRPLIADLLFPYGIHYREFSLYYAYKKSSILIWIVLILYKLLSKYFFMLIKVIYKLKLI